MAQSGKEPEHCSAPVSDSQEKKLGGAVRRVPRVRTAASMMTLRKRTAARDACSAVTGPLTAEYGPCVAGNKKIARTQKTATTASSHTIRPEFIDASIVSQRDPAASGEIGAGSPDWQPSKLQPNGRNHQSLRVLTVGLEHRLHAVWVACSFSGSRMQLMNIGRESKGKPAK